MSKIEITKSYTTSDSKEGKNFEKKWELIIGEKEEGTIDSKVTVKSAQKLAEFLIEGWIEYGFNIADGMDFDDEMKAVLLREWGKQVLKNINKVDWGNVIKEDDDEKEEDED